MLSIMLPEVTLAGFGPHTRQIGLYTVENDTLYCQYLCLTRPALDTRALGEWNCEAVAGACCCYHLHRPWSYVA